MFWPQPMAHGRLVSRYKRFFADVMLDDGRAITAHCPNPGAMLGLNTPGLGAWVSAATGAKRKLPWTLELVEADGGLVGINTLHPNRLTAEALAEDAIGELTGYDVHRREVRMGEASRVDFVLEGGGRPRCWLEVNYIQPNYTLDQRQLWLEVKNCHLSRTKGLAEFPDCVAARSLKHLRELEAMVAAGHRAAILFVVQRTDCEAFSACYDIDPAFAHGLDHASEAGVEVLVYACDLAIDEIKIARRIPWAQRGR
ncbi:MAG TPA: DNA/RNA nuclease SfsA [Caulobacteraceae bacterium]|jgi:sugar fermentation stimulation protein A